jgi:hypothetical protein
MSWTVACFCGTVFESPADRCPTCDTPVPEVTRGPDAADSEPPPDFVAGLLPNVDQARRARTGR